MTLTYGTYGACQSCEAEPAVGVCNVLLAQPLSIAYGTNCLRDGIEAYWVILDTLEACLEHPDGPIPITEAVARQELGPWAIEIIDRSLPAHGKTWRDVEADLAKGVAS